MMDLDNPVVKLCMEGTQAEFQRRIDDARALYRQAWEISRDDYEACIAAHYLARYQESTQEMLYWNLEALNRANAVADRRVREFYPSLYLNLGRSYEMLGNQPEAQRYYRLAAGLGFIHTDEDTDPRAAPPAG
jgi:hypothetical protein